MIPYWSMESKTPGDNPKKNIKNNVVMEPHLRDKRDEIMFSLKIQGYNNAQIGRIFNLTRVRVHEILKRMPANYVSPWVKIKRS